MPIEGNLRNEMIKKIISGTFQKCRIEREILNIRYHKLDSISVGQKEDTFDTRMKSKAQQVTMTLPLTKLNVMVENKTENSFRIIKNSEMVHSYVESNTCIFIG